MYVLLERERGDRFTNGNAFVLHSCGSVGEGFVFLQTKSGNIYVHQKLHADRGGDGKRFKDLILILILKKKKNSLVNGLFPL